jgi:hypothetical protein
MQPDHLCEGLACGGFDLAFQGGDVHLRGGMDEAAGEV